MDSEIHDLAAPYALDALSDLERQTYEAHLAACDECRMVVDALQEGAAAISMASAEDPPKRLRRRVLGEVRRTSQAGPAQVSYSRGWLLRLAGAAAVLVIGVVAAVIVTSGGTSASDVITAADAVTINLPSTDPTGRPGELIYSPSARRAVARFGELPSVDANQTYELWIIDGGVPNPAGLFVPDPTGTALILLEGDVVPGAAVGVTIEPAGGSDTPTGEILYLAEV